MNPLALYRMSFAGFACLLFLIEPLLAAATDPDMNLYAMDRDKKIIQKISISSGNSIPSDKMEKSPSLMMLSPDNRQLLVFDSCNRHHGHNMDARYSGLPILRCKEPTSLTIFDTSNMQVLSRIDNVGWNAVAHPRYLWPHAEISAAWDKTGKRLTVLAWGQKDNAPELVQLNLDTSTIAHRWPLKCNAGEVSGLTQVSNDTAILYYMKHVDKHSLANQHELVIIDLNELKASKELSLPGIPRKIVASPNNDFIYALADQSNSDKAYLHIISGADGSYIQNIKEGHSFADVASDPESGLMYIFRSEGNTSSTMLVLDGKSVKAEIKIPDIALKSHFSPKTGLIYLICYKSIQILDTRALKVIGSIALPIRRRGVGESGGTQRLPSDLALNSSETIGVLGYSGDDEFSVLDINARKIKGQIDLQSGLKGIGKMIARSALMGAIGIYADPRSAPNMTGLIINHTDQFALIFDESMIHAVNLNTYQKANTIDIGFSVDYADMLSNGNTAPLLLLSGLALNRMNGTAYFRSDIINMETMSKPIDQDFRGLNVCANHRHIIGFTNKRVYIIDGNTSSIQKTFDGFKDLRQILSDF